MQQQSRPPVPPFDEETARQKVKKAEDAWNTRDPEKVALAYTRTPSGATATSSLTLAKPSKRF